MTHLPGMKHARSLLDVSIRVLQYFETHAANDASVGEVTAAPEADPGLVDEAENVKAMLSAFRRLNNQKS